MSHFNHETIESVLKSSFVVQPPLIEKRAMDILGAHVEARMRQIIQEAKKFARHGNRRKYARAYQGVVGVEDSRIETVLGFSSKSKVKFIKVGEGSRDKFEKRLTELARDKGRDKGGESNSKPVRSITRSTISMRRATRSNHAIRK